MNIHKNARTTRYSRAEMVRRVTELRETRTAAAPGPPHGEPVSRGGSSIADCPSRRSRSIQFAPTACLAAM